MSFFSNLFGINKGVKSVKDFLKKLLPDSNYDVEFATQVTPYLGNTICAFLNTRGGTIIFGSIEDDLDYQKLLLKENLKSIYSRFDHNPSRWIIIDDTSKNEGLNHFKIKVLCPDNGVFFSYNGKTYYREGHKNRILLSSDINEIIRNRKKDMGLSVLTDYAPTDKKKKALFEKTRVKNNVKYLRLGQPSKNTTNFFKYCSLDVALSMFRMTDKPQKGQRNPPQTMRFVEPPSWPDQYERRFYTADYKKVKRAPNSTPKLYATCFTPREESEPAWQIYNRGKEGLGKRCVQFRLNQIALRTELVKNLKDCTIIEGVVDYVSKFFIDELHLSTKEDNSKSESYEKYFSNFTLDNFINLLLLKRTAYEHEKEVRIFIVYDKGKKGHKAKTKEEAKHKDISLDWLLMLEEIKVDPECTDIEIKLLQDEINRLIDNSSITQKKKKELKKKLKVDKYDVNKDDESSNDLKIGETYADYEKRQQAKSTAKKTTTKKAIAKKTAAKRATAKKTVTKKGAGKKP